jgi:hypothetical protein
MQSGGHDKARVAPVRITTSFAKAFHYAIVGADLTKYKRARGAYDPLVTMTGGASRGPCALSWVGARGGVTCGDLPMPDKAGR